MAHTDLQQKWARAGAEARLREAQTEIDEIFRAFPDLRSGRGSGSQAGTGKKRIFSAKGKAAISEGMRKYWARRKAKAAKAAKA
jgi:hypothetical protein